MDCDREVSVNMLKSWIEIRNVKYPDFVFSGIYIYIDVASSVVLLHNWLSWRVFGGGFFVVLFDFLQM